MQSRAACFALLLLACGSTDPAPLSSVDAGVDANVAADASADASPAVDASTPVTAAALLAKLAFCKQVSVGTYKTDDDPNLTEDIPICSLVGAFYWQADMDIDCDGKQTAQCSLATDPAYQNQTSATDSKGNALDAAGLPYVVIPLPSARFDYPTRGIELGSVVAVLYAGKVAYGIFGDEGPSGIIGEASYAMAKSLGIDPDPKVGGVDTGVTYIVFTGKSGVVKVNEDHAEAVTVGEARAKELLLAN